ncbi:MAG: hypothetical protein C0623_05560 [Desulfuromonas sp.]|nr:MAG: hypothetical protein C0623_05560 [Desulfuromonas sp.]
MDFIDSIIEFLSTLSTENILAYMDQAKVGDLIHNPYFLGVMGVLAVVSLIMKWRVLLVANLGLVGFAWLLSYTLERGTSLDGGLTNDTLLLFIGVGVVIIGSIIYFLFISSD